MSLLWKKAVAVDGYEITHEPVETGGTYWAHDYGSTTDPVGYLRYVHTSPETVGIDMLHVKPARRKMGVGSLLMDRLRADHPGKALVTEDLTPAAQAFNERYTQSRGEGVTALHPGEWWGE